MVLLGLLGQLKDGCGGARARGRFRLVRTVAEEGARCTAGTWSGGSVERYLLNAIVVEVQKGNAMAVLVGYTRTSQTNRASGWERVAA